MAINPLKLDPTRTTLLRRAFMVDMHRRMSAIRRAVVQLVGTEDAFGLDDRRPPVTSTPSTPSTTVVRSIPLDAVLTANKRWEFATDDKKIEAYQTWLKGEVDKNLLTVDPHNKSTPWVQPYIGKAYEKGITRAYDGVKGTVDAAIDKSVAGGKPAFLKMAFAGPIGQSKLKTLSTRAFTGLKGISADMDKDMTRVLAEGLAKGLGAKEVARNLAKSVDGLDKKRAMVIARTEIVHAHNEGQLDAFEAMGVEGVGVMAEWSTAHDGKVCPLCAPLEGIILTIKEARGMLPRHPNCRCAWIPANVGEHEGGTTTTKWAGPDQGLEAPGTEPTGKETGQVWSKDEIAGRIRDSIRAEHPKLDGSAARAASRWSGADTTTVSGKLRPGSKAWAESQAAAKAAKQIASTAAKEAAEAAAQKAALEQSLKIKAGLAQAKLGDAVADVDAFVSGTDGLPELTHAGANAYAYIEHGIKLDAAEIEKIIATIPTIPGVPKVAAQVDALVSTVDAKAAAIAAKEAEKKAALAAAKQITDDAGAVVSKWSGWGVDAASLDHANYDGVDGWGAVGPGSSKTQSYGVVLFDGKGRVLLREPKDHYGGAAWTFAKGGGSSPGTTALKELAEETGHKGAIHDIIPGAFKGTGTKTNYFIGRSIGYDAALMDGETAGVKWATFDEAMQAFALSPDAQVAARDLEVLKAAYHRVSAYDGALIKHIADDGAAKLDAIKKVAASAAHSHKVKVGMAQQHYAKEKFGGGVTASDYTSATKQKLTESGINKVLAEKGWHLSTVPTPAVFTAADDIVAQKAAFDDLKKAGKSVAKIPLTVTPMTAPPVGVTVPFESDLKKIADLPGSTKPYLAVDPAGKKWVVKDVSGSGIAPDHLRSEATADTLYHTLGLAVPRGKIIDAAGGLMKVTEYLEGGQTLAAWKTGKTSAEINAMYKKVQGGFVADALLANHDVAGMTYDNIFVAGGKPYRIDNGGALAYRAQGGVKRTWGPVVTELKSMRDASTNPVTAAIYDGITDKDIHDQIRHIVQNRDALLAAVPDAATRDVLAARIDDLAARLPAEAPRKTAPVGPRRAEYGITSQTPARVVAARSNGVNVAIDRGDIEDNNALVWQEHDAAGKPVTVLQLKVTHAGDAKIKAALSQEIATAARIAPVTPTSNLHPDDVYFEAVLNAAKTTNKHAKDGAYNGGFMATLADKKKQINAELATATGAKKDMLGHYQKSIDMIEAAQAGKKPTAGVVSPYVHKPAPVADDTPRPLRRAVAVGRDTTVSAPVVKYKDGVGRAAPAGVNAVPVNEAYTLDMGEGIKVHYIPHIAVPVSKDYNNSAGQALHGTVRVTVPDGTDTTVLKKAMGVLGDMGLDAAAVSPGYEESLYLHRGVYQNNRATDPSYKKIWEDKSLSDTARVAAQKKWITDNMGIDPTTSPDYDPAGVSKHTDGGGHRYWTRWDLPEQKLKKDMHGYTLFHAAGTLGDHSPIDSIVGTLGGVMDSGGEFTSTTGRIRKGVPVRDFAVGVPMPDTTGGGSASSDMRSGGASYLFTRIRPPSSEATGFHFKLDTLRRQDGVSYECDKFGEIISLPTRAATIDKYKKYALRSDNETLFKEGLSLNDLEHIVVTDTNHAKQVLRVFADRGVMTLPDGRPVKDIVLTTAQKAALK